MSWEAIVAVAIGGVVVVLLTPLASKIGRWFASALFTVGKVMLQKMWDGFVAQVDDGLGFGPFKKKVEDVLQTIQDELQANHGESVKDHVREITSRVAHIEEVVADIPGIRQNQVEIIAHLKGER